MNENENLVTEEVTENVEQTTEETPTPKTYTQEEVDAIVGKRLARQEARIKKDYDRKYGDLTETLKAGTGKQTVEELNDTFTKFYESKGIKINKKPDYSAKDIEVLAKVEADEIIRSEEAEEEFERLEKLGAKMNAREQATFKLLAEHLQNKERSRELAKIGITEEEYNSEDFKSFQKMFKSDIPITKVYEQYAKLQPKKEFKTTGSMKSTNSTDSDVKDYYTPEEAKRFTRKELDNNPELFAAIEKSMRKWRKK